MFRSENSFSPNGGNNGIIKPKFSSITQIQDAQKEQKKLIDDLRKKQWNDLSTGTDEIQIINTQNVQKAQQGLVDLDHELTAAYGLGENGYWNKKEKSYSQGMQNAYGNIGDGIKAEQERNADGYSKGMLNAYGSIGDGIQLEQERKEQAKIAANKGMRNAYGNWSSEIGNSNKVTNSAHAYAQGTGGVSEDALRVTDESLQMRRNSENMYGIGTGSSGKFVQKSNMDEHMYSRGTRGVGFNPEQMYAKGTGGVGYVPKTNMDEHMYARGTRGVGFNPEQMYAKGTGGVEGNFKPDWLREAEGNVNTYEMAFNRIKQITGQDNPNVILTNVEELLNNNASLDPDSIWGQAAQLLEEAKNETGFTYYDTLQNEQHLGEYVTSLENMEVFEHSDKLIQELTGMDYLDAEAYRDDLKGRSGSLTGVWAEVDEILGKAEQETGTTYYDATSSISRIENYLEKKGLAEEIETKEDAKEIDDIRIQYMQGEITEQEANEMAAELGVSPARVELEQRVNELFITDEEVAEEDEGQYQEINDGEAIEYFNATGLSTTYYFTSQNIEESDILEEVISNTQLDGLVDQISISEYTEDTGEDANYVIGQLDHGRQILWLDDKEQEKVQDLAISMNQPLEMPSIPFVDGAMGIALDAADVLIKIVDIGFNSDTNYVRHAGEFKLVEFRVKVEPDIIWDVTYIRHPGGRNNSGSKIFITQY